MMTAEMFMALVEMPEGDALTALTEMLGEDMTEEMVEHLDDEWFDFAEESGYSVEWAKLVFSLYALCEEEVDDALGDPWDE